MLNHASDEMDAALGGFGVARRGGRIPVAEIARAMTNPAMTNHIVIRDSTVGVLNTGHQVDRINAVVTLSQETDAESLGTSIRNLAQAIIDAPDIDATSKKDLLELIRSLGEQAIGVQGGRSKPVTMAMYKAIEERAKGINAITDLVGKLGLALASLFGA